MLSARSSALRYASKVGSLDRSTAPHSGLPPPAADDQQRSPVNLVDLRRPSGRPAVAFRPLLQGRTVPEAGVLRTRLQPMTVWSMNRNPVGGR